MRYYNAKEFRKGLPIVKPISFMNTQYLNIPFAFDTETTSTYVNGEKMAFMYIWQFGYMYNGSYFIYYGRTWEEFINLLETIQARYNLSKKKRIIVYVHNLSFDFQFMRKYINWENVFSSKERTPLKALSEYGIEFRDSYILAALSLAKVGDNLQTYKVEKKVGDLDYKLIRTEKTTLTDKELGYCENDIKVLLSYIQEQIEDDEHKGRITNLPLTNTGRVRRYIREKCYFTNKNHSKSSKGHFERYRNLMQELTLTEKTYLMLKEVFQGGFTHANFNYIGYTIDDVHSIDFTSSYPYVMCSEKFPMSKPIKIENGTYDDFIRLLKEDVGLMFHVRFTKLMCINNNEMYLSEYKCKIEGDKVINNGRVFSADSLLTTLTDIDFRIIAKVYHWDKIEIADLYYFRMDYLPKPIIDGILTLYEEKTKLKGVKGKEAEYLKSKGMLNSVYGMCVTDIVRDEYQYENEWNIVPANVEEQIKKYNEDKKRFLYYPWGVWVTAYARRNLWEGIFSIDDDYIYSDTDSIKFVNLEAHKEFIENYNKNCEAKLQAMCNFYSFKFNRCKPKTIKGKEKMLGVWDYEGKYDYFKTLGAKRYLTYKNKEFQLTVAGLSKQNGMEYMKENRSVEETFNFFNDEMKIPANRTGKQTHTYIDDEMEGTITDYQGHTSYVKSLSGVHLEDCEFTLDMNERYLNFIAEFARGYITKEIQE